MSIVRQDAWHDEHDKVLAETVLSHIRNGSTQLAAFEEAGQKLNRTASACGFRWNKEIRKQYEKEIGDAKANRVKQKSQHREVFVTSSLRSQLEVHQTPQTIAQEDYQAFVNILSRAKNLGALNYRNTVNN